MRILSGRRNDCERCGPSPLLRHSHGAPFADFASAPAFGGVPPVDGGAAPELAVRAGSVKTVTVLLVPVRVGKDEAGVRPGLGGDGTSQGHRAEAGLHVRVPRRRGQVPAVRTDAHA